jgi:hypothetical protein
LHPNDLQIGFPSSFKVRRSTSGLAGVCRIGIDAGIANGFWSQGEPRSSSSAVVSAMAISLILFADDSTSLKSLGINITVASATSTVPL